MIDVVASLRIVLHGLIDDADEPTLVAIDRFLALREIRRQVLVRNGDLRALQEQQATEQVSLEHFLNTGRWEPPNV